MPATLETAAPLSAFLATALGFSAKLIIPALRSVIDFGFSGPAPG